MLKNAKNTNVDILLSLMHTIKLIELDMVPTIINSKAYMPRTFCRILKMLSSIKSNYNVINNFNY